MKSRRHLTQRGHPRAATLALAATALLSSSGAPWYRAAFIAFELTALGVSLIENSPTSKRALAAGAVALVAGFVLQRAL